MRKLAMVFFLLSSPAVLAQQGMDPEIMQQLQEMTACISTVDQDEMKALEKESKNIEAEVKGLCESGNRDKAQELVMEFRKNMVNLPALTTMRKCTEVMPGALKGMLPEIMSAEKMLKDYSDKHVCDEI